MRKAGNLTAAEAECREAIEIATRGFEKPSSQYAIEVCHLAEVCTSKGDFTQADTLAREAVDISRKIFGVDGFMVAMPLRTLASVYAARGDYRNAILYRREAQDIYRKQLEESHPLVSQCCVELAGDLLSSGEFTAAEGLLLEAKRIEDSRNYLLVDLRREMLECDAKLYAAWMKLDPAKAIPAGESQRKLDAFSAEMADRKVRE